MLKRFNFRFPQCRVCQSFLILSATRKLRHRLVFWRLTDNQSKVNCIVQASSLSLSLAFSLPLKAKKCGCSLCKWFFNFIRTFTSMLLIRRQQVQQFVHAKQTDTFLNASMKLDPIYICCCRCCWMILGTCLLCVPVLALAFLFHSLRSFVRNAYTLETRFPKL